jgi:hypothetical protein
VSQAPDPKEIDRLAAELEHARAEARASMGLDHEVWRAAYERELVAERALSAARREQYAEPIEIGVRWDIGAPSPHLISNGHRSFVVCLLNTPDPSWDGTYVTVVDPASSRSEALAIIEFRGVASIRFGAPNDEAIEGHPLNGKGLQAYSAHVIHNSEWLEDHIYVNSVHPIHNEANWRQLQHYVLAFHDDMIECIARELQVRQAHMTFSEALRQLADEIVGPDRTP